MYLVQYSYGCNEQRASRILAIAALRDVLEAFDAEGLPDKAAMEKALEKDIKQLQSLQHHHGLRHRVSAQGNAKFEFRCFVV